MSLAVNSSNRAMAEDYIGTALVQCDANYPVGGYPMTPQLLGLNDAIDDVVPIAQSATYVAEWVASTQSLKILQDPGTGIAEVGGGTNLSTLIVQLVFFGR